MADSLSVIYIHISDTLQALLVTKTVRDPSMDFFPLEHAIGLKAAPVAFILLRGDNIVHYLVHFYGLDLCGHNEIKNLQP